MGLTQSKSISIINKPVWHVWTVNTSFLQVNSMHTSVKAGRARLAIYIYLINFILKWFIHIHRKYHPVEYLLNEMLL